MTEFTPSRGLGQNFMVDPQILARMVTACALTKEDVVLEIGPGQGALTRLILPRVAKLHAVETDPRLAETLRTEINDAGFVLHHQDILLFSMDEIVSDRRMKVVGNLPYYISTPIIEKMLAQRQRISGCFFTVQHEFALRLVARPGTRDYSALTCLVDFYAEPKILFRISSRAFRPMPKVESCLLRVDFRQSLPVELKDHLFFEKIVRLAFLQRRKTIINALASLGSREQIGTWVQEAGLKERSRPGDISAVEYARLANVIVNVQGVR